MEKKSDFEVCGPQIILYLARGALVKHPTRFYFYDQ
jgi:hypothetical protein